VDTGQVLFAFKHNPLTQIHPRAQIAAHASECAAREDRFWPYHDRLFEDPKKLAEEDLLAYAAGVGLDSQTFRTCLGGPTPEAVRLDGELAAALRLTGTPVFFVGETAPGGQVRASSVLTGSRAAADFIAELDGALGRVGS
jgi:protein-disulfide isomerase